MEHILFDDQKHHLRPMHIVLKAQKTSQRKRMRNLANLLLEKWRWLITWPWEKNALWQKTFSSVRKRLICYKGHSVLNVSVSRIVEKNAATIKIIYFFLLFFFTVLLRMLIHLCVLEMVLGAKYDSLGAHLDRNTIVLLAGEKRSNRSCSGWKISRHPIPYQIFWK